MQIDCISDLHGHYPALAGGDLLIIAGDFCANDDIKEQLRFYNWLEVQRYKRKILCAGNHDNIFYQSGPKTQEQHDICAWLRKEENIEQDFEYLCDSSTIVNGLVIYGSPWSLSFKGMNPKCKAFTCKTEDQLRAKFSKIPKGVDILVTHAPPYGVLDTIASGKNIGSKALLKAVLAVKPRYHIFGHVHEQGGSIEQKGATTFINCAYVDECYKPKNEPIRIGL